MKKTVQFDLFAPNQYIYFDILRLAELENVLGKSLVEVMQKGDAGVNFCLAGLQVGLKHHYHKGSPALYASLIEKHVESGGTILEIAMLIIKAITVSGIFGGQEAEQEPSETEKNG